MWLLYIPLGVILLMIVWVLYDVIQRKHAILHNFPVLGHFRYWLESIGPELRQYIVTDNNEERPFSRDQRRWVYSSSKRQNNYFGFGTDNDLELSPNYLILKQAAFPINDPHPSQAGYDPKYRAPCGKVLGARRGRKKAFRPPSIVNISAMSFGSLSSTAVEAINRGCGIADCLQNTGEGGIAKYHEQGGSLIWQLGTAYFGCRDQQGRFSMERFLENVEKHAVRAVEIKLSQGAKPALGGILPAAKITPEIAAIRGIPMGVDCVSPSTHSEFHSVDQMLDFVERLAEASGLPIGIKSAIGEIEFWQELAHQMQATDRGVDFVTIDGGEGGTGAGPLVFNDNVAMPFKIGMSRVYAEFAKLNIQNDLVFIGSGKLGFPESGLFAMGLGCDMLNVGREAMLAVGCIQAQRCHTGHCPTGVATQNWWLASGLDPHDKGNRLANYVITLRKELLQMCRAAGKVHPSLVPLEAFEILDDQLGSRNAREQFGYEPSWGLPGADNREAIIEVMSQLESDVSPHQQS